jgi:hypothetical protein
MQSAAATARVFENVELSVRGQVIRPEHPAYDTVRKIHNGMIDRKPALIVRCTGTADVLECVRLARRNGVEVSIGSGGHSIPGFSVCNGGLMIDLSAKSGVRVDAGRLTARAQAGATWGDFDHETHAYGLATTGGVMRTTGIVLLTLAPDRADTRLVHRRPYGLGASDIRTK